MTNSNEFYSVFNAEQTEVLLDILNEYSKALLKGDYSYANDVKASNAISLVNDVEKQVIQWLKSQRKRR